MNHFSEISAVSNGHGGERQNESQKDGLKGKHLNQGQTHEKKPKNSPKEDQPSIFDIMQGKPFQGHGSLHGHNFQTKVLCLYSCLIHTFKNFKLATEVSAAGKFDDLVLCYEDEDGVQRYTFLQAKQSLQTEIPLICPSHLETNSNFELTKYFQSYIDIQKQFETSNSLIEYLILYTNSDFDNRLFKYVNESSAYTQPSDDPTYIIKKLVNPTSPLIPENSYQFVHIPKKAWKLDGYEDYYKEFQEKLIFAVKQADYNKINDLIQTALSKTFNLAESQTLCNEMVGEIWNVFAQKTGKVMSDEIVNFFATKQEALNLQFQHNVIFENQNNFVNYENYFQNITELKSFLGLKRNANVFCVVSSKTTALTSIKVAQVLHGLYRDKSYPEQYFCIVDVNHLMKQENKDKIFHTLKNKKEFTLVLRWTDNSSKGIILDDVAAITNICKMKPNTKIIFICECGFDYEKLKQIKIKFDCYEDDCTFKNLTEITRIKLMSRNVSLQCQEIKLWDIIDEKYLEQMQSSISFVNAISESTILNIGSKTEDSYFMYQDYIKRFFIRDFKLCKNIIQMIPYSDVLVFSNMELKELEKHLDGKGVLKLNLSKINEMRRFRVFLMEMDNSEVCFELICKYFSSKNIHWLIKNDNSFALKKSVQNSYLNEDNIIDVREQLIVIFGEPGIGKSLVLDSILQKVKAKYKAWAIRINLASLVNALAQLQNYHLLKLDNVFNFICEVEKLHKDYEKELLQYTILKTDHCHLFFDGFDEICPDYEKVVIQLLQLLQTTKANIWLTTRPHFQERLESELSCIWFSIIQFSDSDQKSFLKSYWCNSIGKDANEKLIECFAKRIIQKFTNSHIHLASQLIGIPLQTKMIAEIYSKPCNKFCQRSEEIHNFVMPHNVLELYDEFTKIKFDIYFSEKVGLSHNNPYCKSILKMVSKKLTQQHIDVAVMQILTKELQAIVNSKTFDEDEEFDMLNVGLILKMGEKYSFIHHTYAEYYIAKKLADVIISKKLKSMAIPTGEYQLVMAFLKEHYFNESNKMIRIFFDHILADSTILKATLEDNLPKMKEIIEKDITSINQCDCLGRTAMHLTAAYSDSQGPLLLWKYRKNFQINQLDALDCNVMSYSIKAINKNFNSIMGLADLLNGNTFNSFDEIILHMFNMTNFTKSELLTLKTFISSLYNNKEMNFWNKHCIKTFLIDNMTNLMKVATLLETASPNMPLNKYPMEFFNYALTTDGYFNHLLLNKAIDLSSLSAIRKFTEREPFLSWFIKCVHCNDFACLKRIEDIFGFKVMRKLTQVFIDDCRKMVKQAAERMQHDCVCKFICTYKLGWKDINYIECLEKMFVSRQFAQFDEIYQTALTDEMRRNVLGVIKYVDIFKESIVCEKYEDIEKVLKYFGSDAQIKEIKANISSYHVITCILTHIKKYNKLNLAPFLKFVTEYDCDRVLLELQTTKMSKKILISIKDKLKNTLEISIGDFHLPKTIQWLESYNDAMMDEYNWSVWEHLYCIFISLLIDWPFPPDIKNVFGDQYMSTIIENKASFERVAYIFHLVLDEEKCEICRYCDHEFLRYALCHYFNEITNDKCNDGHYLKNMKDELLNLEELSICFSNAVMKRDFATLLKLMCIIDCDKLLLMYKFVGYQSIFQSALQQLEINFLVKLLEIFKGFPDDLNEAHLFQPLLSNKYFNKLDTLLKYMNFKQALNVLSYIGCVQEFETAIKARDFEKLIEIYDKYKNFDTIIDVMKKNVKDQDCIDYFRHFMTSCNSRAIHSLFQFISWEERAVHPPFLKYFESSDWQIKFVASSKKHLQNLSMYLIDYPSTSKLGSLNIWQHVYLVFGCLFQRQKLLTYR